jgi:ferredoxin-NADP reductase/MOSC domain-containing protein YiiM/ferredoxin
MTQQGPVAKADGEADVASLVSVNVGLPRNVAWHDKTVYTGVWKRSVTGPRMVRRLNIDGDGQGDRGGHGGEQRAVLVYQLESYAHWQQHFGRDDFTYGEFGENFTVDGLADDQVCIGDRYRIGGAEFEVTQPRVTCYRVGLRVGEPELPALLVSHHRPGFYMRVLGEGLVQAGDAIVKTRTGPGALSVADTDALLYLPHRVESKLRLAVTIPALSPGWQQSFRELLADADIGAAASESSSKEPAWTGFRALRVADIAAETATVSSIHLAAPDDNRLPSALAGQYVTVRIAPAGQPATVRSYSLSDTTDTGRYRISVKREPNGVASTYLSRTLRAGETIDVAAPRGEFVLEAGTTPLLLISAGIGVTPVLSMLHNLASRRSEREIWWIHGARAPDEHAFAGEAHALLRALPNVREHVFYSAATAHDRRRARALPGRITGHELNRLAVPVDATAYICGPAAFMDDVQQALMGIGMDVSRIRTEHFGALSSINPGIIGEPHHTPHQPEGPTGTGPLVTFARTGIAVPFDTMRTSSLLGLAEACDVSTRWSCRTGVCHTCVTGLLSGAVSYRPAPLEPPGDTDVLICCARPITDVVLDM